MSPPTGLTPFTTLVSVAVPIDIANCDTDQIIPARFLRKADDDPDYPRFLLHDLRFDADGNQTDFVFNNPAYAGAQIVVADINWGCGSSREAAVRALKANNIRAVIAPSFGDIHFNNCIKNGILPVRLKTDDCKTLRDQLRNNPGCEIAIDLQDQSLTGPDQIRYTFDIEPFDKHRLLNGLDEIGLTEQYADDIAAFAAHRKSEHAWAS